MSDIPATLTPQRIDAMLSGLAEVCFAGVNEAGDRLKAAEDAEAFERTSRALQTLSRNLRQTIALKQRFDREQARLAAEVRQRVEDDRRAAEAVRQTAVTRHYRRARSQFGNLLWNEYEQDEAERLYDDAAEILSELSDDDPDAFLATPLETLVTRLSEEFAVGEFREEPEAESEPEPEPPTPKPPARAWRTTPPPPQPASEPPPVFEAEPEPPPRPPDPPDPPPYIPPWEKLKPGQIFPGGSGW